MAARLRDTYKNQRILTALMDKFQYKNVMEVPKLEKDYASTWVLAKQRKTQRSWRAAVEEIGADQQDRDR